MCMFTPLVLGVYGNSDSGKTTLLVKLIRQLTDEGYKVATIKQTKKSISMDTTNKDTGRHHAAGASVVVFSSRCETDFLIHDVIPVPEILKKIYEFGDFDVVFIEGVDDPVIPKIQVGDGKKRNKTIISYQDNLGEIVALIKKKLKTQYRSPKLAISVNGKDVPLTQFPEQIITHTLLGMLGSLKGVGNIQHVTIHLKQ